MKLKQRLATIAMLILTAFTFVFGSAFTVTGEAEIYHSGKGNIELTVQSDKSEADFKATVDEYLRQYEYIDKTVLITLEEIKKAEGGYTVRAELRRGEYLKGVGKIEMEDLKTYTTEGGQMKWNLEYWAGQDYTITRNVYMNGKNCAVILNQYNGGNYYCTPKKADGTDIDVEALCAYGQTTDEDIRIVTFNLFLSDAVQSVKVNFPGAVSHFAGDAISVVDKDTVLFTPTKIKAKVDIDGTLVTQDVNAVIGYIVYDRGPSPLVPVFVTIGAVVVLGLLTWLIVALYQAGLRRIERMEKRALAAGGYIDTAIDPMQEAAVADSQTNEEQGGENDGNEE